jgi:ParB family chromosome partitioning protein
VVAPARKPRRSFAVEAGGQRLRALNALVGEGKLDPSHEVPCLVIGGGAIAQEASLALGAEWSPVDWHRFMRRAAL